MKNKRNWIIGIALSATAAFVAIQTVNVPQVTPTETPEHYAYIWAYHVADELTQKLEAAIKELNPQATASASFYGEDCFNADTFVSFTALETDFFTHLPVDDLTQHEEFGNWIKEVMQTIIDIPRDEIQGNYGFVEFRFEKSENENITIRVPIQQYVDEAQEKSGVELFEYFYQP